MFRTLSQLLGKRKAPEPEHAATAAAPTGGPAGANAASLFLQHQAQQKKETAQKRAERDPRLAAFDRTLVEPEFDRDALFGGPVRLGDAEAAKKLALNSSGLAEKFQSAGVRTSFM